MLNIISNVSMLNTLVEQMGRQAHMAATQPNNQEYNINEIIDLCDFLKVEIEIIESTAERSKLQLKIDKLEKDNNFLTKEQRNLKKMLKRLYAGGEI